MALHTLQPDLHRVATALRRIADLTENEALSEATAGVADVVVAIKDGLEAERRLKDRICSLNNLSADLTPSETDAKAVSACLDRHGKQWPKGF